MLNIGAGEMAVILIVALLVLGPERLPQLARGIGKFMREFRRQTEDVRSVVEREFYRMDDDVQREPGKSVDGAKTIARNAPPAALPSPAVQLQHTAAALDPSVASTQPLEPVTPAEVAALVPAAAKEEGS